MMECISDHQKHPAELSGLRPLTIFDTTLRDGEQAPGNAMTIEQKLRLARIIADLGVDIIEAGFPAASDCDDEAVRRIVREIGGTKISVLSRATAVDLEKSARALEGAKDAQMLIMSTASDLHLAVKRRISREQALDEVQNAIAFARRLGFADVSLGPEDATRADPAFLRQMLELGASAGADTVVIPDTVGGMLPTRMYKLIAEVKSWLPPSVKVGVHTHDDLGMAVANALAAVEAGADEVQTTLCGIGERAGNAAMEEIVAALDSHREHFRCSVGVETTKLTAACRALLGEINEVTPRGKAVIGANAFATAAGIHQAGIIRNPQTYEFLDPQRYGAERRMVITRHSGRHAIRSKLESLGFVAAEPVVDRIYGQVLNAADFAVCSDSDIEEMLEKVEAR